MNRTFSGSRIFVTSTLTGEKLQYFVPASISKSDLSEFGDDWRPEERVLTPCSIAPVEALLAERGRAVLSLETIAASRSLRTLENFCLGKRLTADGLCKIHSKLLRRNVDSRFRDSAVWVDGLCPAQAALIPCSASMVCRLLDDYFAFINRNDIPEWIRLAIGHYQLLMIHPFFDGNGRLSRFVALINAQRFLPRFVAIIVAAALALQRRTMRNVLDQMREGRVHDYLEYWRRLLRWSAVASTTFAQSGNEARARILSRMDASETSRRFSKYVLDEPLFTEDAFMRSHRLSRKLAQSRLCALSEAGLVEPYCRTDRMPHYECPIAIEFWRSTMESFAASCADTVGTS